MPYFYLRISEKRHVKSILRHRCTLVFFQNLQALGICLFCVLLMMAYRHQNKAIYSELMKEQKTKRRPLKITFIGLKNSEINPTATHKTA